MPVVLGGREGLHRGVERVVLQDAGEDVDEHALAVTTITEGEAEGLLTRVASQAVAGPLLQEADVAGIALRDVLQELQPSRAVWRLGRGDRRQFRDALRRV